MIRTFLKAETLTQQAFPSCLLPGSLLPSAIEAALEIAHEVKDILATAMREAAEAYLKKVPIETDAKICDSWADK